MKLFYSLTSPYARKVRVTAREKGLHERIELKLCNPHVFDGELVAANPLGRIPTLVLDNGETLYDSPVICEWLDSQSAQPRLLPVAGAARWQVLRGQALADGILDDAVAVVLERRRAEEQRSDAFIQQRIDTMCRSIAALERHLAAVRGDLTLTHIAAASALAYVDFRHPDLEWRGESPALSHWYASFSQRPSMLETQFQQVT